MQQGSWVALVTPMLASGEIDWLSYNNILNWQVSAGTTGIVVAGTTGESPTLSDSEYLQVIERAVSALKGRVPLMVGTGTNCTKKTIKKTQLAKEAGADVALVIAPYYNRPTQAGLIAHFKALADSVDIPILIYNHPGRTGVDCLPDTVAKLAEHPNIVGIKEATGDLPRLRVLKELCPAEFQYFSGDDGTCCDFVLDGGDGVISVAANVIPEMMQEVMSFALLRDADEARALDGALQNLYKALSIESNPIPIKWALHEQQRIQKDTVRLPLTPLEACHHTMIKAALGALICEKVLESSPS